MKYNSSGTSMIVEVSLVYSSKMLPYHICFHLLIRCHHFQDSTICKLAVNSPFCVLNASMLLLLTLDNYFTFTFGSIKHIFLLNIDIFFRNILDSIKRSEIGCKGCFIWVIISKWFFLSQIGLIIEFDMVFIIVVILHVNFRCNLRVFYKLRFIRLLLLRGCIQLEVLFLVILIVLIVVYLFTVHMWHIEIAIFFGKWIIIFLRHFCIWSQLRIYLFMLNVWLMLLFHYFLKLRLKVKLCCTSR